MSAAEEALQPIAPDELPTDVQAWVDAGPDAGLPMPSADMQDAPKYAAARARIEREIAQVEAQYQRHVEQATLWRDARLRGLKSSAGRLDVILGGFLDIYRRLNRKSKTLNLPYGVTVSVRSVSASIDREKTGVDADEALVGFLRTIDKDNPPHTKTAIKPAWAELKAHLAATPDGRVIYQPTGDVLPEELGIVAHAAGEGAPTVKVAPSGEAGV